MAERKGVVARCVIADAQGGFSIEDVHIDAPGPNEVLVKIVASGLCHTDVKSLTWQPKQGARRDEHKIIIGHEGSGIVESVGEGIMHLTKGDRVCLNWAIPCQDCFQCRRGNENICEKPQLVSHEKFTRVSNGEKLTPSFNLFLPVRGTMSTYALVPRNAVVKIPSNNSIGFASSALIGCAVMTGYGTVLNVAKVERGSSVVVIGTGAVGLSIIQGAVLAGAGMIIAVDVVPQRLEYAKRFGATHAILADREDKGLLKASASVKSLTEGRGADYAFECASVPALGPSPLYFVRNGGTAVGVSGIHEEVTMDFTAWSWDKIYINPLYGKCNPFRDFPEILRLHQQKRIKLDEMVTNVYRLDDIQKAIDDMLSGKNAKGVVILDEALYQRMKQPTIVYDSAPLKDLPGVTSFTVDSPALGGRGDLNVWHPEPSNTKVRDIVIMLHGIYGSNWNWIPRLEAHETGQRLMSEKRAGPFILVSPSDGLVKQGSCYLDNIDGKNIERWILHDVVETVTNHYKIEAPVRVYLTGLSMGGWGALRLAARASKEGLVNVVGASGMSSMTTIIDLQPFLSYDISYYGNPATPHILDCIKTYRATMPPFRFDIGRADSFIEQNRALHAELTALGIPHEYQENEGAHSGTYWTKHLADTLLFFEKIRQKLNDQ